MRHFLFSFLTIALLFSACAENEPTTEETTNPPTTTNTTSPSTDDNQLVPPHERWGDLFVAVQTSGIFPDSKTFVDCVPKESTADIMTAYAEESQKTGFDLKAFVTQYFALPPVYGSDFVGDASRPIEEHINALWEVLTRQPDAEDNGSLIALPNAYIVPGGRFREVYYWDSYFTMLGLQEANRKEDISNMVSNFAHLIDEVGFIPNGNRTYYLTRSQPPFFCMMLEILVEVMGQAALTQYLPQLEKEYQFWMDGSDRIDGVFPTIEHAVYTKNGAILNRYFDTGNYPRSESYIEDVETAAKSGRDSAEVYAHLRAGAESGWDFSSRWFDDPQDISTIRTTDIIPVDLNALLFKMENTLSVAYARAGNSELANRYARLAQNRREAIIQYCWNEDRGFFMDYDFVNDRHTNVPSLAGMYPLFFALATPQQAAAAAAVIERDFLKAGGVVSTLNNTGQQWDYPNGWAPLQWITIKGLRNYNQHELADKITQRWIDLNKRVYQNTAKLVEKYNVVDMSLDAGGGEYPNQDGFGWTNGVLLRLLMKGGR